MIGTTELILVLVIVFVVFGAGKLPDVAASLGKGLKKFKEEAGKPDAIDVTPEKEKIEEMPAATAEEMPTKKAEKVENG